MALLCGAFDKQTQKYIPFSMLFVVDVAVNNTDMLNITI